MGQFFVAFSMWTVMMVAMMLPTAVPAIRVFGGFAGKRKATTGSAAPTPLFALGYATVWTAYSLIAAAGQTALSRTTLVTHSLHGNSVLLTPAVLILAGGFQFTRLKDACLSQCRSPFPYFLANWRDGNLGAFTLGMQHGSYCVGCCWALMGLMFVTGSMSLLWMGALSAFMLSEKVAPAKWNLHRAAGAVLILWGVFLGARRIA